MEAQFFGANCLRISTKKAQLVIDDNLAELGQKPITKKGDIVVFTHEHQGNSPEDTKLMVDRPGEYEVSGVSLQGIAARSHMDEPSQQSTTIFKIIADDINIVVTGHIYPELSDDQLEALGRVDVLFIPVGGNGYTLDGVGALKIIKAIEPKLIVPTHYEEKGFNFPVPQQPLAEAVKGLAMEPQETVGKLKVKPSELTDTTQLVILEKQ